jgi:hypothetical protein
MSLAIRLRAETLRTVLFGSISGTYMGIGTAFNHPIRIFHLQNLTDQLLIFSFDGINDTLALPSNGFLLLDVTSNKTIQQGFFLADGDRIYVKDNGTPATTGAVYLSVFYGQEV